MAGAGRVGHRRRACPQAGSEGQDQGGSHGRQGHRMPPGIAFQLDFQGTTILCHLEADCQLLPSCCGQTGHRRGGICRCWASVETRALRLSTQPEPEGKSPCAKDRRVQTTIVNSADQTSKNSAGANCGWSVVTASGRFDQPENTPCKASMTRATHSHATGKQSQRWQIGVGDFRNRPYAVEAWGHTENIVLAVNGWRPWSPSCRNSWTERWHESRIWRAKAHV